MFDMNRMCESSFNKKINEYLSMDHLRRLQHLFELETENYLFHSAHSILIFSAHTTYILHIGILFFPDYHSRPQTTFDSCI